jgi:hypothetical protein
MIAAPGSATPRSIRAFADSAAAQSVMLSQRRKGHQSASLSRSNKMCDRPLPAWEETVANEF